ncbi:MAG: hypothetical protein ACHQ4J_02375 [Candidatus Binatia bacterium]
MGSAACLLVLAVARRPVAAVCVGDCGNLGSVSIANVQACINIFLDTQDVTTCSNCDQDGNGSVGINEVQGAVNSFLDASTCPMVTPHPGASPTPTNTVAAATSTPANTPSATPTSTPSATRTNTVAPTATNTLPANTATFTATRTRTPTRPTATPTGTPTSATPALGQRVFELNTQVGPGTPTPKPLSQFVSSLARAIVAGIPQGTMVLNAGAPDANGQATVTLGSAPAIIQTDISVGGLTLCTRLDSCTGTLYCNGGANVDLLVTLDSLRTGLTCLQNGMGLPPGGSANLCIAPTPGKPGTPTPVPLPCCSNACEGICTSPPSPTPGGPVVATPTPCVNSGHTPVSMIGVNATDSGHGALALLCMQRIVQMPLVAPTPNDCTKADYSTATLMPEYYTTGSATAEVLNFCAENTSSSPANKNPTFSKIGTDFDCTNWTTAGGPGVFAFAIPSEEGSDEFKGDGSNVGLWSDK